MNKIFNKVPVQIQNRSGFDLSHQNLYTTQCGTLTPILVDQLIPGDWISLGHLTEVQLPQMATDFYGRVQFKIEAFFCPNRLCYRGFQQLMTQPVDNVANSTYARQDVKYLPYCTPHISLVGAGSLADYLGFKSGFTSVDNTVRVDNILPFIAYHKIWNDFYRDSLIQKECFAQPFNSGGDASGFLSCAYLPSLTLTGDSPTLVSDYLEGGKSLFDLRQRNFSRDYFTNAKLNPQAGTPSTLAFNVDNNVGSFTIASLRAANSLQQWMERNNLAGSRYIDQIRSHYGVTPSDAVLDRPVYLGSHSFDIYNKSVYQQGSNTSQTNNPMQGVAAKFASSMGVSDASLVDSFKVTEFGFLFVIASIVPDATYSTGVRRYLSYNNVTDFANPILSAIGDQAILRKEIAYRDVEPEKEFGYTQRYSEYKFMMDEVHGLLRDGESLESFALQRSFDEAPDLGSEFIEIPTDYMDQVTAVTADMSKFGGWCNTYFRYKKSSVLPAYSIPTLGDPKDTHTEVITNGGTSLR